MSTTDLFLSAFGGKEPEENGQPARKVGDTTDLFLAAFGHDTELKNYTPEPILDYELNAKVGTDTGKLFTLDALMKDGVQYRDLPNGLRDLVKPKRPLAKELRKQEDETGMSLEQREKLFDALQFNVDYLASLENVGMSPALIAEEYAKLKERFPEQAIEESLAETNQQLLAKLKAEAKAKEVAANQAKAADDEERNQAKVAQEIADAKAAIEALNDASALTDEQLQAELTRRAAAQTRAMGDGE